MPNPLVHKLFSLFQYIFMSFLSYIYHSLFALSLTLYVAFWPVIQVVTSQYCHPEPLLNLVQFIFTAFAVPNDAFYIFFSNKNLNLFSFLNA